MKKILVTLAALALPFSALAAEEKPPTLTHPKVRRLVVEFAKAQKVSVETALADLVLGGLQRLTEKRREEAENLVKARKKAETHTEIVARELRRELAESEQAAQSAKTAAKTPPPAAPVEQGEK